MRSCGTSASLEEVPELDALFDSQMAGPEEYWKDDSPLAPPSQFESLASTSTSILSSYPPQISSFPEPSYFGERVVSPLNAETSNQHSSPLASNDSSPASSHVPVFQRIAIPRRPQGSIPVATILAGSSMHSQEWANALMGLAELHRFANRRYNETFSSRSNTIARLDHGEYASGSNEEKSESHGWDRNRDRREAEMGNEAFPSRSRSLRKGQESENDSTREPRGSLVPLFGTGRQDDANYSIESDHRHGRPQSLSGYLVPALRTTIEDLQSSGIPFKAVSSSPIPSSLPAAIPVSEPVSRIQETLTSDTFAPLPLAVALPLSGRIPHSVGRFAQAASVIS